MSICVLAAIIAFVCGGVMGTLIMALMIGSSEQRRGRDRFNKSSKGESDV